MRKTVVLLVFTFIFSCLGERDVHKHPEPAFSQQKAERVLGLFDLSGPDLEEVRNAYKSKDLRLAFEKLLEYYRNRTEVKTAIKKFLPPDDEMQFIFKGKPLIIKKDSGSLDKIRILFEYRAI